MCRAWSCINVTGVFMYTTLRERLFLWVCLLHQLPAAAHLLSLSACESCFTWQHANFTFRVDQMSETFPFELPAESERYIRRKKGGKYKALFRDRDNSLGTLSHKPLINGLLTVGGMRERDKWDRKVGGGGFTSHRCLLLLPLQHIHPKITLIQVQKLPVSLNKKTGCTNFDNQLNKWI